MHVHAQLQKHKVYEDHSQMLLPYNFSTKKSSYMHLQACVQMLNIKNTKYMEITVKCCCLTTFHKNIFVYAFTSMCPMVWRMDIKQWTDQATPTFSIPKWGI